MPAPHAPSHEAPRWHGRLVALVGLAMVMTAMLPPGPARADHSDLAGRWQLDGPGPGGTVTPDSSGHGNDAAIAPGTPFSLDGRLGGSLDLRTDLYDVRVPPAAVLEAGTVTVTAWVKARETPGAYRYLVAKGGQDTCDLDPTDDNSSYALRTGADDKLHFVVWNGVTVSGSESPSADVFDNQWHAVAGVFDGARARLYVDGVQVGDGSTATGGIAYGLNEQGLMIGRNQCQAHFPALIDDVRVYRRALGAAEVALLASGQEIPTTAPPAGDPGIPPPAGTPPRNTARPAIRAEDGAPGTYRCDPGSWEGLAPDAAFRFTWRDVQRRGVASSGPTFTPQPQDFGYTYFCIVSVTGPGGDGAATSDTVFFTRGGINTLPPAYGNVAIRGIDVFQTVQPNSGAQMYDFPSGAFPSIPGAGTPTSFRLAGIGGLLTSVSPQKATYRGVTLDALMPTTASVYVATSGSAATDRNLPLTVTLVAKRGGKALGAPLVRTLRDPAQADSPVVQLRERQDPRFSTRFRLPTAWVAGGSFDLEARVSLPSSQLGATYGVRECDGECADDNVFSLAGVRAQDMPQLVVDSIQLTRSGQSGLAAPTTVLGAASQLFPGGSRMKILPYRATLDISTESGLTATQVPGSAPASFTCNGLTYGPPNFTTANAATRACRSAAISARLAAWVAQNPAREIAVRVGATGLSSARIVERYDVLLASHDYTLPSGNPEPGWQANGTIADVSATGPTDSAPYLTVNSRVRPLTSAAHELGHALTAPHADQTCGGNANGQVGEPWAPDNQGRLQGTKFVQASGLPGRNSGSRAQVDDPVAPLVDLMSYCADLADTSYRNAGNAWLSARNWNRFRLALRNFGSRVGYGDRQLRSAALFAAKPRRSGPVAVGWVGPDAGRIARILPPDPERGVTAARAGSPVRLRSLAADGKVLLDAGVDIEVPSESPAAEGGTFLGPVAPKAATVELVRDGATIATLRRSGKPTVRLASPRAGARVGRTLVARWRSDDPDGDPLSATVRFSPDAGRTWRTVYDGRDKGSARIPGRFLEGARNARVRVDVTDGFAEATAVSRRFRAVGAPPVARIVSPSSGDVLVAGEKALLVGTGFDDRTETLTGRALRWYAGKRALGRGEQVTTRLKAGPTVLRLVARDRLGRSSTARIRVRVESKQLRIVKLRFPRIVASTARRVTGAIAVSAPATLSSSGRNYRLGTKPRKVTLRLPTRPRTGLVRSQFTVKARGAGTTGRIRAVVEVVRR